MIYSWASQGKCHELDTNLFFEKYEEDAEVAGTLDRLCMSCPVQAKCLATAVSNKEWGVWGGVYFEDGKISRQFNKHKTNEEWFDVWTNATMEKE
jgi:hypothetical protein